MTLPVMTEESVPGNTLRERSKIRLFFAFLLLFVVLSFTLAAIVCDDGQLLVILVSLSGLTLMGLILLLRGWDFYDQAFKYLASQWREISEKHSKATLERERAQTFIKCFRPTQDMVDAVLRRSASMVRAAYEYEVKLQRHGVAAVQAVDDVLPDQCDIEDQAGVSADQFRRYLEKANRETQEARDDFWVLWNLAHERGYKLKQSWKPYADLPWQEKA